MQADTITVRLEVKDSQTRGVLEEIMNSAGGFVLQAPEDRGNCDLLILETGDDSKKDFERIHQLQSDGIVSHVFLTSKDSDPDKLIRAMRAGVKEFILQPVDREEAKSALLGLKARQVRQETARIPEKSGKIITVFGSKGGVGATTVAVNLAANFTRLEGVQSVAVMDMNLVFGEIPLFLGMEPLFDWVEVAKNISRLDATYLSSILYRHTSELFVLPSPAKVIEDYRVSPAVIEKILNLMKTMFDYVVIDNGQCLDEVSKMVLKLSDKVLLVTVLSLPCLINLKRVQDTFHRFGYPFDGNIDIVVNRYLKKSLISLKEAEDSFGKSFLWTIPNDYHTTMSAINQGKPISVVGEKTEISASFKDLASTIAGKRERKESASSWRRYLRSSA
ncbi:MAG TPA: AAA family ATPase [Syntrophales bacterium]|jgi:pilus assembly protein CpaE|nr:AAA family ATPase [Syntrophales bacterium]HRT60874.1 AAA family ATPase [Syntrophales bacterium]